MRARARARVYVVRVRCLGFTGNRLTTVPRTGLKVVGEVYIYIYTSMICVRIPHTYVYDILTVFSNNFTHARAVSDYNIGFMIWNVDLN